MNRLPIDRDDVTLTALVKGEERYIFIWNEANRANLLRTFGKFASDKELAFSWYDAACLSNKVRHAEAKECNGK